MPMYKKSLLVLFCITLFASVSTFYYLYTQEDTTPIITDNMQTQTQYKQEDTTITVYVSGEVNSPGLVELPSDSRIADAIKACGDFTPLADKAKINLAQKLTDGMQIQVSSKAPVINSNEQVNDTNSNSPNNNSSSNLININTATKEDLDTLPGIGPATAQKIIDYRQEHGNFSSIEDIKNVKGIGEAKFSKMQDKICT
ncbi:MAG: ComEA family DNA-binding protein [Megamonas funiformis]|uniref:ComEA family DNA-binding protein n=1 Tax=Megamonas funiformis TaxID=437897 RepID=UPI002A83A97C|nr:ComEA family DNA-binding protein [Megamonas funiformis]MDY3874841.1 ComEA family DNA-binding protein [Megamonas funiformis]